MPVLQIHAKAPSETNFPGGYALLTMLIIYLILPPQGTPGHNANVRKARNATASVIDARGIPDHSNAWRREKWIPEVRGE
jgi:hypothetical protein